MAHLTSHAKRNVITLTGEPSWRNEKVVKDEADKRSWTQRIKDETMQLFGCSLEEQKKKEAQFGGEK